MSDKLINFLIFMGSLVLFYIVPWGELRVLRHIMTLASTLTGLGIGLVLLLINIGIVMLIRKAAQKMKVQKYLMALLIPLMFWMGVTICFAIYIGYRNGNPLKNYLIYHICEQEDSSEFCLCKTNYVTKNLPYLFDYKTQYDAVSVINEHVPDLEQGIRECRLKFNIKLKEKK